MDLHTIGISETIVSVYGAHLNVCLVLVGKSLAERRVAVSMTQEEENAHHNKTDDLKPKITLIEIFFFVVVAVCLFTSKQYDWKNMLQKNENT